MSAVLCLVLITSCGKAKRIDGRVLSESGEPLEGVLVQVANSEFVATTKKDGRYSLEYAPGTFQVVYAQQGRFPETLSVTLSQKSHFPASEVRLLRIPAEPGIVWVSSTGYVAVPITEVRERVLRVGRTIFDREVRDFSPKGEPVVVSSRAPRFLDTTPQDLLLIKLDDSHRIANVSYGTFGLNSNTEAVVIAQIKRHRSETCVERTAVLAPGDYAFVSFSTASMVSKPGSGCFYFRVLPDSASEPPGIAPIEAPAANSSAARPSYAGRWEWDGGEEGSAEWELRQSGPVVEGRYEWNDGSEEPRWAEVRGEVKADGSLTLTETRAGAGENLQTPSGRFSGHIDASGAIVGQQTFTDSDWRNEWKLKRVAASGSR